MDIHERIDEIAEDIKLRPCVEELKKQETLMENDLEVIRLSEEFSIAQLNYSDGLKHYSDDSNELKTLYKKMLEAKNKLDSNPIVVRYYELLSEVNEPLNYLQFNMLSLFKNKHNHSCK